MMESLIALILRLLLRQIRPQLFMFNSFTYLTSIIYHNQYKLIPSTSQVHINSINLIVYNSSYLNIIIMYKLEYEAKCVACASPIRFKHKYQCCNREDEVCIACSIQPCKLCKQKQSHYTTSSSRYGKGLDSYTSKYLKKCARCNETQYSLHQIFQDGKCDICFCFQCTLASYQQYLSVISKLSDKDGIKPELPIQLPCGCQYSEQQVITYIKKSCFACSRKIDEYQKCYEMVNNTRIMKICYDSSRRKAQSILARNIDKETFQQIEASIARCSGCGNIISEIGNKVDDIFICKECFKQMKDSQKLFQQEKQIERMSSKAYQKNEVKAMNRQTKSIKKQCSICSRLFVPEDKDQQPLVCKYCLEKNEQIQRQIKGQQLQQQKCPDPSVEKQIFEQKQPQKQISNVNSDRERQEGGVLKDKIPEQLSKQQLKKEYLQTSENKQKSQNQCLDKSGERAEIPDTTQLSEQESQKIDKYQLKIDSDELEPHLQCSQCLILFKQQALFKTFQKDEKQQSSIRVIQNDLQLSRMEEEPVLLYYCHLCYFQLKFKIHWERTMVKKQKQRQELYTKRFSQSLPKRQKTKVDDFKSTLFTDYKHETPIKPMQQAQKMAFTTSKKYQYDKPYKTYLEQLVFKKRFASRAGQTSKICIQCKKPVSLVFGATCDDCRFKTIKIHQQKAQQRPPDEQKCCKLCRQVKNSVSNRGYCQMCLIRIYRDN